METKTDARHDSRTAEVKNANNMKYGNPSSLDSIGSILQCPLRRNSLHSSESDNGHSNGKSSLQSKSANKRHEYQHAALPRVELYFYISVIGFLFFYTQWHVYQLSKEKQSKVESFLGDSWSFLRHLKKDSSDYQWSYFTYAMTTPKVMLSFITYVILGQLVILVAPKLRKAYMLMFSTLCIYMGFGGHVLLLLLVHAVIVYVVCHTRKPLLVWIIILLEIGSFNVDYILDFQTHYISGLYMGVVCIRTSNLRLLCFGLEFCRKPEKPASGYNFLDLLLFNFYLPVFPYGPFIGYDTFLTQINGDVTPLSWKEFKYILKEMMRFLLWTFIAEFYIHLLFFGALTKHTSTLKRLTALDLSMLALLHLMFFQLKTLVVYSFPRIIALFERIEAPVPLYAYSVYTFSETCGTSGVFSSSVISVFFTLLYFDRGITALLTKYIYFPLGGSKHGILRQSFAVLMCFTFTAFWHGSTKSYFSWALLNWVGVQLETTLLAFSSRFAPFQRFQKRLSGPMLRRFHIVCAVPNYLFLASANLVFVLGTSKTYFFVTTIVFGDWPWNIIKVLLACYCCIQVMTELERKFSKEKLLSKKYI